MLDSFYRKINYLRISITDRCNLRCNYCIPEKFVHYSHNEILQYEEFLRLCTIMAQLGVDTFRVTGGEPLVRKNCVQFIRSLKSIPGAKKVTLTTNGVVLNSYISDLVNAGLDGINISLDSVCARNYKNITGVDAFDNVWQSIQKAVEYGLPTKINTVIIKGVNDHEILPIAALAEKLPLNVRFIELMPTKANAGLSGVPSGELLKSITSRYEDLAPDSSYYGPGPARYYSSEKLLGKIGFISPLNHNFCQSCNRLRISSTGFLRLCLHHHKGIDLRHMLRSDAKDDEIKHAILSGILEKPQQHFLEQETNLQDMSKVGG